METGSLLLLATALNMDAYCLGMWRNNSKWGLCSSWLQSSRRSFVAS